MRRLSITREWQSLFSFKSSRSFNPDVPEKLDSLIAAMLDIVPAKRPVSSDSVTAQLIKIQQSLAAGSMAPALLFILSHRGQISNRRIRMD